MRLEDRNLCVTGPSAYGIEGGCELGIAIADQDARPRPSSGVPAEHRLQLDQQHGSAEPWQSPGQGGEHETIGLSPADNLHLAFEDADLVPQPQQLGLISGAIAKSVRGRGR